MGIAADLYHMQSLDSEAEGVGYYFCNVSLASERENNIKIGSQEFCDCTSLA